MNRFSVFVAAIAIAVANSSAFASIDNITVTVNGTAGPVTVAPSASVTANITADITNGGGAPSAWASTNWAFTGSSNSGCSEQPNPDVTPAPAATTPGTANITGMTAPATAGTYALLFIVHETAGCTGNFIGIDPVTVTVAEAEAPQSQAVPALPLFGMVGLFLGILLVAGRNLFSKS